MANLITVLSEYQISAEKREDFLKIWPEVKRQLAALGARHIVFYEGADQPGLFVEQFEVAGMDEYEALKTARRKEIHPIWGDFHACVPGGKEKVHVWAFVKME